MAIAPKKKCMLICAGVFDGEGICIAPDEDTLVIAVDGGYSLCNRLAIAPDILIGDFDSACIEDIKAQNGAEGNTIEVIRLPHEKDDTDTMAAVRIAIDRGAREIELYGASGGRPDHFFANLQTLLFIKHNGADGRIIDGSGEAFIIENEQVTLENREDTYVSLFSLGEKARGVTIRNLYYEVENALLSWDYPIGVSNEFIGKAATVSVSDGALLCILTKKS